MHDYKARYYSAVLGRFVSPDSIVPEPGSSGGFNRYRYTRNNPLKYTDPSGHAVDAGCGCGGDDDDDSLDLNDVIEAVKNSVGDDIGLEVIRQGFPTTIGLKGEVGFGWDMFLGMDNNVGVMGAYNWYSNEFGLVLDAGTIASGGTPRGLELSGSAKAFWGFGATNLDSFAGPSQVFHGEISKNTITKLGLEADVGWGLNPDGSRAIDPISKGPIVFSEGGPVLAVNGVPNGVEVRVGASVGAGSGDSRVINSREDFSQLIDDVSKWFSEYRRIYLLR